MKDADLIDRNMLNNCCRAVDRRTSLETASHPIRAYKFAASSCSSCCGDSCQRVRAQICHFIITNKTQRYTTRQKHNNGAKRNNTSRSKSFDEREVVWRVVSQREVVSRGRLERGFSRERAREVVSREKQFQEIN